MTSEAKHPSSRAGTITIPSGIGRAQEGVSITYSSAVFVAGWLPVSQTISPLLLAGLFLISLLVKEEQNLWVKTI